MVIWTPPELLRLGPLAIGPFGLAALLGLTLGLWLGLRRAAAAGLPRAPLLDAAAWVIPIGVLGARLVFVLGSWDQFFTDAASIWQLPLTGLSLWGGLVSGGLAASAYLGARGIDRARVADAVAPGLALGILVGRIGEFFQGVGQGTASTLPWATRYTSPLSGTPDFGLPRHPAQLYDAAVALALLAFLAWSSRLSLPAGARFWLFLGVYGAARVALGPVQLEPPFLFGLQIDQLLAGGAALVAAVQLARTALPRPARAASAP
jgi:phosphatidylglycerol---prolipoprotein diacylglyceryl transferase